MSAKKATGTPKVVTRTARQPGPAGLGNDPHGYPAARNGSVDVLSIEDQARRRRAQERLLHLDEMRDAGRLATAGLTQREIAETLHTTQPRVHRMLKACERRPHEATPEEIILRATIDQIDRATLVQTLQAMTYTFRKHAPGGADGVDGVVSGLWDQVRLAAQTGLLTESEFETVRATVEPPRP